VQRSDRRVHLLRTAFACRSAWVDVPPSRDTVGVLQQGTSPTGGDFVGRDAELEGIVSALADPHGPAVVIAGPAGVGKTRLAAESERAAVSLGFATARVVATKASASIPFGAFASLISDLDPPSPDRLALLRKVSAAITDRAVDGRILVVVDDAHLLDDGSAALVHHLVQGGSARLVVTIRSQMRAPDPVTSLWKDGLARRVDLAPLDLASTEALTAAVLGGPVSGSSVRWLYETSVGNPLHLRELLSAASESGSLLHRGGIWILRLPLSAPERLADLVAARLSEIAPKAVDVVEMLAIGEPLELDLLEHVCGEEAVEYSENHGLIVIRKDGDRLFTGLAHPLYGEVLRQRMPRSRFRRLSATLAESLESTGSRRRDDLLRAATWRLDAGMPTDPALLSEAARSARQRFDHDLAARLARAALNAGGGVDAGLVLAEAEFSLGRHTEAEEVLAGLVPVCNDDAERADVANARVYNLGMLMGDTEAADRVLEQALEVVKEPAPRHRLLARIGIDRLYKGEALAALADSEEVIRAQDLDIASRGTYIKSVSLAVLGECDRAVDTAYLGLEIARARTSGTQPAHAQLLGSIFGHVGAGRFDRAEADARYSYGEDVRSGNLEGVSTHAILLGWVLTERGDLPAAVKMFRESTAINEDIKDVTNLRLSLGGLALAEGMSGNSEVAAEAAGRIPDHWAVLFDPDLVDRGRAWAKVAGGEISAACADLRTAADRAAERSLLVAEAKLRHDLVRLGEARTEVERLAELSDLVDGDLAGAFAQHAHAVTQRSAAGLESAAGRFESVGAKLLAAEALQGASAAYQREGLKRQAASATRRAADLRQACGDPRTPGLAGGGSPDTLTRREREVAVLAASGLSSREIAERLFVSVRTVDNQLQRAYTKLGVKGRDALREALGT